MPTPYRYTAPVKKGAATGVVAAVYAQIERDFVLADGPLMSLSPVPNLLAATWAVVREAEVVGKAPRGNREVLAAAVSATNRCTFCVDAHSTLVHATGAHGLAEEVWSGGTPRDPELAKWSPA